MPERRPHPSPLRKKIHEIIFEAETPAGKFFDITLLVMILLSVIIVMLESVPPMYDWFHDEFYTIEWILTILFTIEYILRLFAVRRARHYATSFYGVIDLLAILPTYLSVLYPAGTALMAIRALRMLRLFRIFKLVRYVEAYRVLLLALRQARPKIVVFIVAVFTIVTVVGSMMYLVEPHEEGGFSNIPVSIYWAIVTVTTVGFGDITPTTDVGRFFAAILMLTGYAIIAVPTGIVSVEISKAERTAHGSTRSCPHCGAEHHAHDATYCHSCGDKLEE